MSSTEYVRTADDHARQAAIDLDAAVSHAGSRPEFAAVLALAGVGRALLALAERVEPCRHPATIHITDDGPQPPRGDYCHQCQKPVPAEAPAPCPYCGTPLIGF